MNKVYITQINKNLNYKSCEKYGKPVPVWEGEDYSTISHCNTNDKIRKAISKMAAEFKPFDYLLVSGDPHIIAMAYLEIMEIHGAVKTLKWDKLEKAYTPYFMSSEHGAVNV